MFVQLAEFWWGQHIVASPAPSQLAIQPATVYRHRVSAVSALLESYFSRGQQCGQHSVLQECCIKPTIREYKSIFFAHLKEQEKMSCCHGFTSFFFWSSYPHQDISLLLQKMLVAISCNNKQGRLKEGWYPEILKKLGRQVTKLQTWGTLLKHQNYRVEENIGHSFAFLDLFLDIVLIWCYD